jgi:hypothetical protein
MERRQESRVESLSFTQDLARREIGVNIFRSYKWKISSLLFEWFHLSPSLFNSLFPRLLVSFASNSFLLGPAQWELKGFPMFCAKTQHHRFIHALILYSIRNPSSPPHSKYLFYKYNC